VILRETCQVDSMENYAMAAKPSIDPARFLHDQLDSASPDLLRSLLTSFLDALMSAEADAVCGAPYGMPSPDRVNVRNGYRHRDSGHPDGDAGAVDSPAPFGVVFPGLAAGYDAAGPRQR
jgi:putative transposase